MDDLIPANWPMVAVVLSFFPRLRNRVNPYAIGSATLIKPTALVTAAHVLYDPTRGGYASRYEIRFGDGSTAVVSPNNSNSPTNVRVRTEWIQAGNLNPISDVDAGVILLDSPATPPHATVGLTRVDDLLSTPINVLGFPAARFDTAHRNGRLVGARTVANDLHQPLDLYRVAYPVVTFAGMSGGPVLRADEIGQGTFIVRGVHTSLYNGIGNGLMLYTNLGNQVTRWADGLS